MSDPTFPGSEPGAPGPFPGAFPPASNPPPAAPAGPPQDPPAGPVGPPAGPLGPPSGPMGTTPAPVPAPSGNGRGGGRTALIVAGVVVVLALIGAVTFVLVNRSDQAAAGEIFLEAATAPGPDPFTTQIASEPVTSLTTTTRKAGTTTTTRATTSTTAAGTTAVNTSVGSTPGLYGGTNNNGRCDARQLAAFLAANPDKGKAWVEALNSDPTLTWSQGNKVRQDQIGAYIAELTPVTLVADTRVTNYGYVNGRPTPRQSVLQAGTAVLVDRYGTPRAKCGCGNPLTQPIPVKATPVYTGPPWPGWNPTTVVVVQNSVTIINNFTLVNIDGDGYIVRPAGTDGGGDTVIPDLPDEEGPPTTTRPTTTAGPTSTTTAPDGPTSSAPPMTAPVDPTGDFCADIRSFIAWADAQDADISDQQMAQLIISQFAALVDESPPEVRADMEYFQGLFERLAAGGDLGFLNDPQFQAANDRMTTYLRDTCGIQE